MLQIISWRSLLIRTEITFHQTMSMDIACITLKMQCLSYSNHLRQLQKNIKIKKKLLSKFVKIDGHECYQKPPEVRCVCKFTTLTA